MTRIQAFLIGILAAVLALFFELAAPVIFSQKLAIESTTPFDFYLLLAGFFEEFFKIIFLYKIYDKFENEKGNIFLAFIFGLGFASFEIFLNILNNSYLDLDFFLSYLGLALIHILTCLIYGFGIFRRKNFGIWSIFISFIFGYLFHFLFNFSVLYSFNKNIVNGTLLFFLIFILSAFLPKRRN